MKLKKLLAPLMAVSLVAGAMPVANVSAESKPKIYVDLTYEEDGDIRADIMLENTPNISEGSFHVEFGDGWKLKKRSDGRLYATNNTCDSHDCIGVVSMPYDDNDVFVTFSSIDIAGFDLNGSLYSIYLEKSENFNPNNATANVVFQSSSVTNDMLSLNGKCVLGSNNNHSPVMLEAHEYIVGDVNNDGMVNAVDSTCIFTALKNKDNSYNVNDIKYTYKSLFPDALCAAAPDANSDGTIEHNDAMLIMQYYADLSTGHENNSGVGRRDIYEIFND